MANIPYPHLQFEALRSLTMRPANQTLMMYGVDRMEITAPLHFKGVKSAIIRLSIRVIPDNPTAPSVTPATYAESVWDAATIIKPTTKNVREKMYVKGLEVESAILAIKGFATAVMILVDIETAARPLE
ncbi:hypothetical protein OGATHE_004221 [Ogataea polymorpha]|uniref:Uncharacterized protein n=1 Tax=Ogataea polymorpha TaxID=460523 RepID=A0A9P8T2E6_9ASCO|nr:hypothetical protein OGATHE_004221 [Ogataea polymorpha]